MTIWAENTVNSGWKSALREMAQGVSAALIRFPAPIFFLCVSTFSAFVEISGADIAFPLAQAEDYVPALTVAAVTALAAKLFVEGRGLSSHSGHLAGLLAGTAIAFLMLDPEGMWVQEWSLSLGIIGVVLLAPFICQGNSSQFWMFSLRVGFAAVLSGLALILFAGGISATLATLGFLFGFEVDDRIYGYVWAFTALLASPVFGLGQLPDRFDVEPGLGQAGAMDRGMRALGDYVAAPLLILYAVILHIYAIKIAFTAELPRGQVGWLVITYGFCLFGALLVIHPFLGLVRAPTRLVLRYWPTFMVVPLILLALALWQRVGAFGFTPDRYMVMLFGSVSALILAVRLVPSMRGDIRPIFALPVFALLIGSFGPQGARNVSVESQAHRFKAAIASDPGTAERQSQALAALRYLSREGALKRVAPDSAEGEPIPTSFEDMARAYGLDPEERFADNDLVILPSLSGPFAVALHKSAQDDFDIALQNISLSRNIPLSVEIDDNRLLAMMLTGEELTITENGKVTRFPVAARELAELQDKTDRFLLLREIEGKRVLMLVPLYAFASAGGQVQELQALVFLRSQEWE
ncbi:DUF4153 domain-containing protein [Nitratireductor sp. CH_MIT9313-5]|uniref:DUF4153 domain-containing protein n=1 Tax=Nitratireductor sp. CH_MIT9313-5 TaxID=3107764 RepID=UPI00300B1626